MAVDFESARSADGADHPVQIGLAESNRLELCPQSACRWFLRPAERVILTRADVHGIAAKDLVGACSLLELWPELQPRLTSVPLLAHGAGTERRFLRVFPFARLGPWIDTLQLSRKIYPGLASYALGDLVVQLGLEPELRTWCPDYNWHDALFDAFACLLLFHHLIHAAKLEKVPIEQLLV